MAGRLKGKVALVTAAGQGIGRAIAETFAAEGAIVIATDIDEGKLKGLKAKKRLKLDVLSAGDVEALAKTVAKEFGGLDVLVNVAGYVHHGIGAREHRAGPGLLLEPQRQVDAPHDQGVPAWNAEEGRRLDRQHVVGGVLDPRRADPLCLRHHQGRGDRADQIRRDRFHPAGHPLQRHLSRHDRVAVVPRPGRRPTPSVPASRSRPRSRISSTASRWAGSAPPRRSRCSRYFWRPTNRASPPATRIWWTAAGRCNTFFPLPVLTGRGW